MSIAHPLLKQLAFINGTWQAAKTGAVFNVVNPADGSNLGSVPDMGAEETRAAIEAAEKAFTLWRGKTGKERAQVLRRWHDLIVARADELASLLTLEQGKPLAEAKGEILSGAAMVEWSAEEAKRLYGDYIPAHRPDARIIVTREPVGIVGAITPWNFPSSMITRKVAPALAAGCSVVLKPAEDTPLSALALAVLAEEAGFIPGLFNVVTASLANAPAVGQVLCEDDRVRKMSFTGSTEVGRILMKQGAPKIKKISLELGGNAPFIVFPSADLDKAVEGLIALKFRNCGQACTSANRVYVHSQIAEDFIARLKIKFTALKIGTGMESGVHIGPMINPSACAKVEELLADAKSKGAKVVVGGQRHARGGTFFEPTLLVGVTDSMRMAREEIFGPVAPVFTFTEEGDVLRRANNTEYGLAAYIYSQDQAQVWRVTDALEYGMVAVNEPLLATELAPFGGVKQSGIGREGSKYSLEGFTELKYRLLGGL